ncbi:MAG: S16 family serine protease [Nanoarchaeota archaeon]
MIIFVILIGFPFVAGKEGEMKLLAMSQKDGEIRGHVADLHLKITPGSGRVYMDTYPLTELDTQISIRFAREIACDYLPDVDCSRYDFFYTIRSNSIMIGGPSAGAALTMLTLSTLEGWELEDKYTVTGTIKPGGFIGNVGGIGVKLEAAAKEGIETVFLPTGSLEAEKRMLNQTQNLVNESMTDPEKIANENNISIIEVSTLDDILYELRGIKPEYERIDITANEKYTNIMKQISKGLCNRTEQLLNKVEKDNDSLYDKAMNLSEQSRTAIENNAHYSASSFCFGANVNLNQLKLNEKNLSDEQIKEKIKEIRTGITDLDNKLEEEMQGTINDLQIYMVVKERLKEAENFIVRANKSIKLNETGSVNYNLVYGEERLYSAEFWAMFLGQEGKKFNMDDKALENSCIRKLTEAEERLQYANLLMGGAVQNIRESLDVAHKNRANDEYALCLFRASKSKAEADLLLGSMGVTQKNIDDYIDVKLRAIENIIKEQQELGIFPILGYSYYEYAKSLRDTDPHSAMLYSEYALELSKIEFYFSSADEKKELKDPISIFEGIDTRLIFYFLVGVIFGILFVLAFYPFFMKKEDDDLKIRINRK